MDNLLINEKKERLEAAILPPTLSSARKHFAINVLTNIAYQGAHIIVSLWMTPFLIGFIGIAAYGMVPLVNTITSYLTVFTTSLNLSVGRFLAIDLGEGDNSTANQTFNTALFGLFGIIIILIPAGLIITLNFSKLFIVPVGWEKDANGLFACVIGAFFISVVNGMFSLSPFIHSRFLLSNIVNFAALIGRVIVVIILFTMFQAHLWYAGWGILFSALISFVGFFLLWRKLTPMLHIRISDFCWPRLKVLTGMSGWMLVNTVGGMLLSKVDLVVVNAYYGAAITGGYGAMLQFSVLIETLVTTISTVIRPVILLKYAQKDFAGLKIVAIRSVKLFGLTLALPVGLICGMARPLISVWLGPTFEYLSLLLIIMVCHQSISQSIKPLLYIQSAYNKVKWPGIVTLICGIASVTTDIFLAQHGILGYIGIAGSTTLIWTFRNAIYNAIYTGHIMNKPWWTFIPSLKWSVIGTLFVALFAHGLTSVYYPTNWLTLGLSAGLVTVVYVVLVWMIGLDPADKQLLFELIPYRKLIPSKNTQHI